MAITGVNGYSSTYAQYAESNQKNNKSVTGSKSATEDVKNDIQNQDVSDYYNYLQKNYSAMKSGNVSIAGEYLKKCASDKKKAQELEDFIKKIPELEEQGYKQLAAHYKALGGTVTYYQQTWTINKDGSVQSTVYSVTEKNMTNAERMKKNMDEQLEKQKEKKAEEEREEEKKEEEKALEEKIQISDTVQIDELNDNKLYQSMKIEYVDASSMEELEDKMQQQDALRQSALDTNK